MKRNPYSKAENAMWFVLGVIACLALTFLAAGYHIVWKPTPDQLYGCTVAQQAPNGECQ